MPTYKRNSLLIAIAIVLIAAFTIFSLLPKRPTRIEPSPTAIVQGPEFEEEGRLAFIEAPGDTIKTISIEIAEDDEERIQGLMRRSHMAQEMGMLFIFDEEEEQSFWMKNTKIPLDILYVNAQKEIVTIYKHTQPYSESPIPSFKPALYVVEVIGGFCDTFGVEEGDYIVFERVENQDYAM
jgi:uncharacterized membrane protein (UPF0127 family)